MKRRVRLTPWRRSPWRTSRDSSKDTETRKRIPVAGGRPRLAWTWCILLVFLGQGSPGPPFPYRHSRLLCRPTFLVSVKDT